MLSHLTLVLALLVTGCASVRRVSNMQAADIGTTYTDTQTLQSGTQAIVDAFATEVERIRGEKLSVTPVVEIRNKQSLISFNGNSNTIVVPWWGTQPHQMRAVFRQFAGGTDAEAALFLALSSMAFS